MARKRSDALQEFWFLVESSSEPRLVLLQRFATVHIPLGREHARATRRRFQHRDRTKEHEAAEPCFVCGKRATQRHHIIQVQHGGTNRANNLVPICGNCHTAIHPWLGSDESAQPVVT